MKSTSSSKNGETHSCRRHRLQPQSIPFMAKKRVQTGVPEAPRSRRRTLQGYSKHGGHHRHSRRDNTARHLTRKPRRYRVSLRRHRIPLPQKLRTGRSERSHTIPQTKKKQPPEAYRPTSMETHDTLLQAKQPQMDDTLPHAINGRDSLLSDQTNPRPPTHIQQKRPPETRTHHQSNRLQHHSPNQNQAKRSLETEPRTGKKDGNLRRQTPASLVPSILITQYEQPCGRC
jgi:hypothetical protein